MSRAGIGTTEHAEVVMDGSLDLRGFLWDEAKPLENGF